MAEAFDDIAEILRKLQETGLRAAESALIIVKRGQTLVEGEAKKSFTGAHPRGGATTSAPGGPPDVVTGTLRRSIVSDSPERSGLGAVGRVYPTAVYARIQELGGGKSSLPARPYMQPALEASQSRLSEIAAEEWARILP